MSVELDEVRSAIAARHGLTEDAAGFLVGSNVEEVEASAGALSRLIGRTPPGARAPEPANIVAVARAAKTARKAELLAMFTGKPTRQRRDERGRFTLDGGARPTIPTPRSPEREHGEVIAALARLRSLGDSFPGQ